MCDCSSLGPPKDILSVFHYLIIILLSSEATVPDYKPPFEVELGPSITSEHIRDYVARQKRRPGFPDVWKNNHPVRISKFIK